MVDPGANLVRQRAEFKTELPSVAAEGQHSCRLEKPITALTTLHELALLPYRTIATNLVDRRNQI
jgi:hypothetical protein